MLDELILNLTTLGKLRPGDKLSVHYGRLYISQSAYTRPLRRFLSNQNRYDTISFISTTANYSLAYAKSISNQFVMRPSGDDITLDNCNPQHREELSNLYQAFLCALNGLDELKNSYSDDRSAISSIDVICNNISNFVEDCKTIGITQFFRLNNQYCSVPISG